MRNLFYLHSHITYYVAKGIIKELNLDATSIVFIVTRNYRNIKLTNFNVINLSVPHDFLDDFSLMNFFNKQKAIPSIDSIIEENLKAENYRLFLPHVFHPLMQILATNEKCLELHIMEEGVNAYSPYLLHFREKNYFKWLIKSLLNRIYFIGLNRVFFVKTFDLRKFIKGVSPIFYTVTRKGFQGIPYEVKTVEMIPDYDRNFKIDNGHVVVLEGAVEQGNCELKTFLSAVRNVVGKIDSKLIYVKFHPAQHLRNRNQILKVIEQEKREVKVIPDVIAFEQIMLSSRNLNVYGFTSSLLFYAKEYGCKVISFEEELLLDLRFKKFRSKNDFDLTKLLND